MTDTEIVNGFTAGKMGTQKRHEKRCVDVCHIWVGVYRY